MMNAKVYEAACRISDDAWCRIALELERYAFSVSRRLRWRTLNPVELPKGETVDSIVSKAFEKFFSGERNWDPEEESIDEYFRNAIDSFLSHLAESPDNTRITPVPEPGSADGLVWESGSRNRDPRVDWMVPASLSPEEALLEKEESALEDRALDLLEEECAGDELLTKVLQSMINGAERSIEIAEMLGIDLKDVRNAAKRLDRKSERVRQRIAAEQKQSALERKRYEPEQSERRRAVSPDYKA